MTNQFNKSSKKYSRVYYDNSLEYREELINYLQGQGVQSLVMAPVDGQGKYNIRVFFDKEGSE